MSTVQAGWQGSLYQYVGIGSSREGSLIDVYRDMSQINPTPLVSAINIGGFNDVPAFLPHVVIPSKPTEYIDIPANPWPVSDHPGNGHKPPVDVCALVGCSSDPGPSHGAEAPEPAYTALLGILLLAVVAYRKFRLS